ncbi:unnamed protein product [Cylicocyclus nassatus]|uniref:N-acetyltransferase domain-containing protein n=1 Tax=Cylicocyclus nassatus TaxID=53992 RepID=A0AA36H9C0_CYLNA|nr:unnamed protein product [Cylicocyclus nassatus]
MADLDYEVVDSVPPDDHVWSEWKELVEKENWSSDDQSVLTLTPSLPTTRVVMAKKKQDGSFIGCVIWNEYDNIAFLGFYLLIPEARGKGIGSLMWKRALDRMPKDYILGLRAVPSMALRYKSKDTPVDGPQQYAYTMRWQILYSIAEKHAETDRLVKLVRDLTDEEYHQLEQFDRSVTKRDRTYFLRRFHDLPFTVGTVLFDKNNQIVACASVCPTTLPANKLYKIAPIYASNVEDAFTVIRPLLDEVKNLDNEARIILHILTDTAGFEHLAPLLSHPDITSKVCDYTLYSKPYENPTDKKRLFIAHNNSGHFDA